MWKFRFRDFYDAVASKRQIQELGSGLAKLNYKLFKPCHNFLTYASSRSEVVNQNLKEEQY